MEGSVYWQSPTRPNSIRAPLIHWYRRKLGCHIFAEGLQAEKEMMSQLPSKNGLIMFETKNGLIVFKNSWVIFSLCQGRTGTSSPELSTAEGSDGNNWQSSSPSPPAPMGLICYCKPVNFWQWGTWSDMDHIWFILSSKELQRNVWQPGKVFK